MRLVRCERCGWETDYHPFVSFLWHRSFHILRNDILAWFRVWSVNRKKGRGKVTRTQRICPDCFSTGTFYERKTSHYGFICTSEKKWKI